MVVENESFPFAIGFPTFSVGIEAQLGERRFKLKFKATRGEVTRGTSTSISR